LETFGLWLLKYSCACRHVWVGFMLGFAGLLDRWQSVENISGSLQINMLLIPSHHMRWGLSLKWNSRYAILYIPIGKWNNVFSLKHHSFGLISLCYQILLLFFFFFCGWDFQFSDGWQSQFSAGIRVCLRYFSFYVLLFVMT